MIKVKHDEYLTLIYSKEEFRIKDVDVIKKVEEYIKKLD
jgi:hypothetical protein